MTVTHGLRIMHLITDLDIGGAETMLARLVATMDRQRFDNVVVSMMTGSPAPEVTLYLLDVRNRLLGSDKSAGPVRTVERNLAAGVYIVAIYGFVKKCDDCTVVGARLSYTLEVSG